MKTYTYSEARQRLATLLDQAKREGRAQIRRQDGSTFILQPVTSSDSPLDVPGVRGRLARGELAELIRSERAQSGDRVAETPSDERPQPAKAPPKPRSRSGRKK